MSQPGVDHALGSTCVDADRLECMSQRVDRESGVAAKLLSRRRYGGYKNLVQKSQKVSTLLCKALTTWKIFPRHPPARGPKTDRIIPPRFGEVVARQFVQTIATKADAGRYFQSGR